MRKERRKRAKGGKYSSSCSCSDVPTSGTDCSCCCHCSSCSTSDSDNRFTRYYQLPSHDSNRLGSDIPAEPKNQRGGMVRLLLHTMVMWDEIWRTRNEDSDSSHDERGGRKRKKKLGNDGGDTKRVQIHHPSSEDDYDADDSGDERGAKKTQREDLVEEDEVVEKRLQQALEMTEDTGVFFSGTWYGQPLEELDPFIYDDTFCVLSWRGRQNPCVVYRYYKGDSLGIFAPDHPLRVIAYSIITHRYFGNLIVTTILANCVTLAMERFDYDEFGMRVDSQTARVIEGLELLFLFIYTCEMWMKIIAKGFVFQRMAYLRNGWNVVDFIVVVSNYITIFFQVINDDNMEWTRLDFLRIFRVLRAVKTISILPGLRKIVNSLVNSSKELCEVMILTLLVIMMLSLLGMEFFGGKFRNRCVRLQGITNEDDMDPEFRGATQGLSSIMTDRLYAMWIENEHNWLYRDSPDSEPYPCGNSSSARACPDGYVCLEVSNSENPNSGWMSFDSFHLAAMQTLQVMTLDYWERLYELTLSTLGREAVIYFVIVIFIGGFYLLNLMLAVVTISYEKEATVLDVKQSKLPVPKRLMMTRNLSTFNFEHLNQQRLRLFEGFRDRPAKERDELLLRMIRADGFAHPVIKERYESSHFYTHTVYKLLKMAGRYMMVKKSEAELRELSLLNEFRKPVPEDGCFEEFWMFDGESDQELEDETNFHCLRLKSGKMLNFNLAGFDQTFMVQDLSKFVTRPGTNVRFTCFPEENKWEDVYIWLNIWSSAMKPIVEDWKWQNLMTFFIFLYTVISCLEHHNQPDWLDLLIYLSNELFTCIFSLELFLKAVAYQHRFFDYGWNKFDLFVVVGSILDSVLQSQLGFKGLRALKLLRILKLAQAWETMKIMLNILISAMADMANLLLILFIAIYIFAVFGMQYLGSGYEPRNFRADFYPANYPRWAWQTIYHAFLMVFRVVCGEWINLISECFEAFNQTNEEYKCFLTFIPTLVFGNFIVLNLFLALLLHIFDAGELSNKTISALKRQQERGFLYNISRIWKRFKDKFCKSKRKVAKLRKTKYGGRAVVFQNDNSRNRQGTPSSDEAQDDLDDDLVSVKVLKRKSGELSSPSDNNPVLDPAKKSPNVHSAPREHVAETGSREVKLVMPHPKPRWRLYTIVMKYRELIGLEHDSDDELEDDIFDLTGLQPTKARNKEKQREAYESFRNRRFKDIAYRVIFAGRKRKAEQVIRQYVEMKTTEMKNACRGLNDNASAAQINESALEPDLEEVPPCFPPSWYSSKFKCFVYWLWGWPDVNSPIVCDRCRRFALRIVRSPYFEWILLVVIIGSSVLLCLEDTSLDDNPSVRRLLLITSMVTTSIFLGEFLLKIFAEGVYTYFSNAWSILDFFLVIIGIACLDAEMSGSDDESRAHLNSLKVLRTLKALRPLRAISRWHGMKIVVNALISAIPAIFNVLCVCLCFWLVFAIMGVQFFKGRFYKCVNELGETVDPEVAPDMIICCQKAKGFNFAWVNTFPNFDSVPEAYISLLFLATFEGWVELMRVGVDARDIDQQPVRDYDISAYMYYVAFCLFGGFLTTNLFIGVIIDNFNALKKRFDGNLHEALMSPLQRKYYWSVQKLGRRPACIVLPKPKNPTRLAFYEVATSQRGEFIMFIIILLNMILMCVDSYDNDKIEDAILEMMSTFFIFLYTLEAIVKILGLGSYYFRSMWNVIDLLVLLISMADYVIGDLLSRSFPIPPSMVRFCRILRVGRVMRLLKTAKGIRRLVFALLVSLPALFNVGALLLLIIFIYSILGMNLFGRIGYGGTFDEIINFETFPSAFLILFRLITSAGWNDVLDSLTSAETICGDPDEDDCGGPGEPECVHWLVALAFVSSYLLITNFVIVNMYIAIILENYEQATEQDEFPVSEGDIDAFFAKWAVFDCDATQFMELRYLSPLLNSLEAPLRMKYPNQISITALDIPIYQKMVVHVLDVMRNLIVFKLGQAETQQMQEIQTIINSAFAQQFRHKRAMPIVSTTRIWKIQHNAATTVQRFWRRAKRKSARTNYPKHEEQPEFPTPEMAFIDEATHIKIE